MRFPGIEGRTAQIDVRAVLAGFSDREIGIAVAVQIARSGDHGSKRAAARRSDRAWNPGWGLVVGPCPGPLPSAGAPTRMSA